MDSSACIRGVWFFHGFLMLEPCSNFRMVNFCFQCMLDLLRRSSEVGGGGKEEDVLERVDG